MTIDQGRHQRCCGLAAATPIALAYCIICMNFITHNTDLLCKINTNKLKGVCTPDYWLLISNQGVGAHTRTALTHTSAAISSHLFCNSFLTMQWFTHSAILPVHNDKNIAKRCEQIAAEMCVSAGQVWARTPLWLLITDSVIRGYELTPAFHFHTILLLSVHTFSQ